MLFGDCLGLDTSCLRIIAIIFIHSINFLFSVLSEAIPSTGPITTHKMPRLQVMRQALGKVAKSQFPRVVVHNLFIEFTNSLITYSLKNKIVLNFIEVLVRQSIRS